MTHHDHEQQQETNDPQTPDTERPDPPGNPAEHTSPRSNPDADPDRLEIAEEDRERTIGT
jgi:hypothetical protein